MLGRIFSASVLTGSLLFGGCDPTGPDEKQPDDRAPRFTERVMDYDADASELFVRLSASDDNASTLDYACSGAVSGSRSVAPGVVVEFRAPYAQERSSQQVSADCSVDDGVNTPVSTSLNASIDGLPDVAPSVSMSCSETVTLGAPASCTVSAGEDFGLDQLVLDWGDSSADTVGLSGLSASETLSHVYDAAGSFTASAAVTDDAGQVSPVSADISVSAPQMVVDLEARLYLSGDVNTTEGLSVYFAGADGRVDTLVAGPDGRVRGVIPKRDVLVTLDDVVNHDYGWLTLADGSLLHTDMRDHPMAVSARDTLKGVVETVDASFPWQALVEQSGVLVYGKIPRPRMEELSIVFYWGNPNENPIYPAGLVMPASSQENSRNFYNEFLELRDWIVEKAGVNPWPQVTYTAADTAKVLEYFTQERESFPQYYHPDSNVQLIKGSQTFYERRLIVDDEPKVIDAATMGITSSQIVQNWSEQNIFGLVGEYRGGDLCLVKAEPFPADCPAPDGRYTSMWHVNEQIFAVFARIISAPFSPYILQEE